MPAIDVALVRPWSPSAVPKDALVEDPLGVGYLTAVLRQEGFNVVVLDAFALGLNDDQVVACIAELRPRITAFSLHSFADYRHFLAISSGTRMAVPEAYQVVGGEHASFLAKEILATVPNVDAVVMGEGELTLTELAQSVLADRTVDVLPGAMIRHRDKSMLVDGGFRFGIEDLDAVPWPHKDVVELALKGGRPVAVSLLSGRGCTHKCTFCTANTYLRLGGGNVWRRRDPVAVADEFEWLARTYVGRSNVHPMIQFQDVIFLGTSRRAVEWTEAFVSELERRQLQIPYYFMARADAIIRNEHLLPRLARTGLSSVEVGIETGVDRILEAYNKRNSRKGTIHAIALLQQNGICYDASGFIMFDPDVTLEEMTDNAMFLRTLGHATWDRYVTRLQVFPGTAIKKTLLASQSFDPQAKLDDVYAYRFRDARVAELADHVSMYDPALHQLNNLIRAARARLSELRRQSNAIDSRLQTAIDGAQDLFCEYFLSLIGLVERERMRAEFTRQLDTFLAGVTRSVIDLSRAIVAADGGDFVRIVPTLPVPPQQSPASYEPAALVT